MIACMPRPKPKHERTTDRHKKRFAVQLPLGLRALVERIDDPAIPYTVKIHRAIVEYCRAKGVTVPPDLKT